MYTFKGGFSEELRDRCPNPTAFEKGLAPVLVQTFSKAFKAWLLLLQCLENARPRATQSSFESLGIYFWYLNGNGALL